MRVTEQYIKTLLAFEKLPVELQIKFRDFINTLILEDNATK